jgi:hypothetical protein
MAEAGAQAVAHEIAYQPGFSIDNLQGALGTVGNALAATRALVFVYLNYYSFHNDVPFVVPALNIASFRKINIDADQEIIF